MHRAPIARVGLALLAAAVAPGCEDTTQGGGLATVAIVVPDSNAVAPTFSLDISVANCTPKSVKLYDRNVFVEDVAFVANPTHVVLTPAQIRFTKFSELLKLKAKVTCTDGRTAESLEASASYWPVREAVTVALPPSFAVEGSGDSAQFIGCRGGQLVRMNKDGSGLLTASGVPGCSNAAIISDRHPVTRLRWLFDPPTGAVKWNGALAFNPATMAVTAVYSPPEGVKTLGVGPDGNAVVWVTLGNNSHWLRRIRHDLTTTPLWDVSIPNALNSEPVVDPALAVVVPMWQITSVAQGLGMAYVNRYNYSDGVFAGRHDLTATVFDPVATGNPAPPASLNPSGSLVYFPDMGISKQAQVYACSTIITDCSNAPVSPGFKWESDLMPASPPPVARPVWTARPFAKGSRIAAITETATYFLDADTGKRTTGPIAGAVQAGNGLVPFAYLPGLGREFWMLNGPNGGIGPTEIVGLDSAEAGVLYRYSIGAGDLTASTDDAGDVWLRIVGKMVRPYSMPDYRRGLTP